MSMMICDPKPREELERMLSAHNNVFLVGCNGCGEVFGAGGSGGLDRMAGTLVSLDKEVSGRCLVDFVCEREHDELWLGRKASQVDRAGAVVVVSCGIGVQVIASLVKKPVYPALNTLSRGGRVGQSWGIERCRECGDCVLAETAGVCPLTACGKQLRNGPCGGSSGGKCEVYPNMDCGWAIIYRRLKEQNRLDLLKRSAPPKKYSKSMISEELLQVTHFLAQGGDNKK